MYLVVWIAKYRRKILYGQLQQNLGEVFHKVARQKESKIFEGYLQPDHVHMLISIPSKFSVSVMKNVVKSPLKAAMPEMVNLSSLGDHSQGTNPL